MFRAVKSFLISGLVTLLLVVSAPSSSVSVARDVYIDAGRDLVVQSRQNVSSSSNFGFNFNVSFGPSGPTGLSIGGYYGDGNRQYTDSPTTIVARRTLDIYTGRTTYLLGAMLNSKSGDLRLDTDDFIFDHFEDTDKNIQVGGGISFDLNNLANSDAHGSLQYRNKEGLTYATVGFGQIVVRGDKRDLSGLNRDVENLQVTTQNINFNIAIPGVNLKKLAEEIKGAAATIDAATADIPQPIRDRGEQAVDAYRDAILNGLSGVGLRQYIASDFFARTVSQRNSWLESKKQGNKTPEQLAREAYLIGRGEKLFFDERTKQMMIATDCGTSGYGATPCGVPLSSLSKISKDQVLKYINDSINLLQSVTVEPARYNATLKAMIDCAMAWTIQGGENGFNYMEVARQAIPAGSSYDSLRVAIEGAKIIAQTTKLPEFIQQYNNASNYNPYQFLNYGSALVDIATASLSSKSEAEVLLRKFMLAYTLDTAPDFGAAEIAIQLGNTLGIDAKQIHTAISQELLRTEIQHGKDYKDELNAAETISERIAVLAKYGAFENAVVALNVGRFGTGGTVAGKVKGSVATIFNKVFDTNSVQVKIIKHPDGSYRTPDGKFASQGGMPAPGTESAKEYTQFLRNKGFDVIGEELTVKGGLSTRRYDAVVRDNKGELWGIEYKSGTGIKTPQQEFNDMYINRFGAVGVGRLEGKIVVGNITIYLP